MRVDGAVCASAKGRLPPATTLTNLSPSQSRSTRRKAPAGRPATRGAVANGRWPLATASSKTRNLDPHAIFARCRRAPEASLRVERLCEGERRVRALTRTPPRNVACHEFAHAPAPPALKAHVPYVVPPL